MTAEDVQQALQKVADPQKAKILARFFKTGPGEYGEGDCFIGVVVPAQRLIAKEFRELPLNEVLKLLQSKLHEERLCALLILTYKYPKLNEQEKKQVIAFYLKHVKFINNWDLVDLSAPKLLGQYLLEQHSERKILYKLAKSQNLWERRIAILATYSFIKRKEFTDTLKLAELLLTDKQDLLHKAVGWMLREVGKLDQKAEEEFLRKHAEKMPRTMLRYAIERFEEKLRRRYLETGVGRRETEFAKRQ